MERPPTRWAADFVSWPPGTAGASLPAFLDQVAMHARDHTAHGVAAVALELAAALTEDHTSRYSRLAAAAAHARLAGQSARAHALSAAAGSIAGVVPAAIADRGRAELFAGNPELARSILTGPGGGPHRGTAALAALIVGDWPAVLEIVADDGAPPMRLLRALAEFWLGGGQTDRNPLGAARTAVAGAAGLVCVEYRVVASQALALAGEHRQAMRTLVDSIAEIRSAGALGMLPFALHVSAQVNAWAGNLAAARESAVEATDLSRLNGSPFWQSRALGSLARVQAIQGDERQCRDTVAQALALADRQRADAATHACPADAVHALGLLEMSLVHYADAATCFQTALCHRHHPTIVDAPLDMLEAQVRAHRDRVAVDRIAQACSASPSRFGSAAGWRLQGMIADDSDVDRCFANALERHGVHGDQFETARTRLAYGERLRRSGRRLRARQQLGPALDTFNRIGARLWAARADAELLATGRSRRSRPPTATRDPLTPQEHEVARLVATGVTNREAAAMLYLSAKTVEFHLGNVYRKLGIRCRTELVHRIDINVRPRRAR